MESRRPKSESESDPKSVTVQPPRWGLGDVAIGFILSQVLALMAASLYLAVTDAQRASVAVLIVSQPALWVGLGLTPVWASRRKGSSSLAKDFGLSLRRQDVGVGIIAGLLSQFVLIPLLYVPFRSLLEGRDLEGDAQRIAKMAEPAELAVLAVLFVVGAPLVEELFFRGLLLRSLTRHLPHAAALVFSSAAFALVHFEPLQIPALFAVGVVFGALTLRSGRLGPALWAHGAFNAVVVVAIALQS